MTSLLLLSLLVGMRHAIEADHVAAVASLVSRNHSMGQAIKQGAAWGLGHTLTLFLMGAVVLVIGTTVPELVAQYLELAVGVMLVVLGIDVLRRLIKQKIHFHVHQHNDGVKHFHAHAHQGETQHNPAHHQHDHPKGFPLRALMVGLMHGMAGSAALILLTLETVSTPIMGLLYIAVFGIGSIVGMALLSCVIAVPLRYSATSMTWLHNGLHAATGVFTLAVGSFLIYEIGMVEGALLRLVG